MSSNRFEGAEADQFRMVMLHFGKSALRDRDDEVVRGYRDVLKFIYETSAKMSISKAAITTLHKRSRGEI